MDVQLAKAPTARSEWHSYSLQPLCQVSIFHRIWTCSRSLLTYIMRWRVLIHSKFQGLFSTRLIASTGLPWGLCRKPGGRGKLEWITWGNGWVGKQEGRVAWWWNQKKKETQIQRNAHIEKLTDKYMQKEAFWGQQPLSRRSVPVELLGCFTVSQAYLSSYVAFRASQVMLV